MRAGKLPIQAISGTMGVMESAAKVMKGFAAAGQDGGGRGDARVRRGTARQARRPPPSAGRASQADARAPEARHLIRASLHPLQPEDAHGD